MEPFAVEISVYAGFEGDSSGAGCESTGGDAVASPGRHKYAAGGFGRTQPEALIVSTFTETAHRTIAGRREQQATRIIFFVTGFAMAAWAPLVPVAKLRLGIDDGGLGLLLLCLGAGSIVAMPLTGILTTQIGCRRVIVVAALIMYACFPLLASIDNFALMAITVAIFGASLGTVDVAMNLQSVMVERDSGRAMLSGIHARFSMGGITGAAGVSALLGPLGLHPVLAAVIVAVFATALLVWSMPGLVPYGDHSAEKVPLFVMPRGSVLFIAMLCFLCFLAEGSILDWSAVFLISMRGADVGLAGLGYATFAVSMTIGRLFGDTIRTQLGERAVLLSGGLIAAAGFLVVLAVPNAIVGLLGFLLVGFGASNVVPVLFSVAGNTKSMPAGLAVTAISTIGYAGILAGPAIIGFIAHATDLRIAFLFLVAAMLALAASYRVGLPRSKTVLAGTLAP